MRLFLRLAPLAAALLLVSIPAPAQESPGASEQFETVTSVYDGDTFRIAREIDHYALRLSVRVIGIDTPERGSRARCASERRRALLARDQLRAIIAAAGDQVLLRDVGWDRYGGRIDARVFVLIDGQPVDVAALMIAGGHARAYDGRGRRQGWCGAAAQ